MQLKWNWRVKLQKYVRPEKHLIRKNFHHFFFSISLALSLSLSPFYIMKFFLSVRRLFLASCLVKAQVRSALNFCVMEKYIFRKFFLSSLSLPLSQSLLSIYWSLMKKSFTVDCCWVLQLFFRRSRRRVCGGLRCESHEIKMWENAQRFSFFGRNKIENFFSNETIFLDNFCRCVLSVD